MILVIYFIPCREELQEEGPAVGGNKHSLKTSISQNSFCEHRATVSTRLHPAWFSVPLQALERIVEMVRKISMRTKIPENYFFWNGLLDSADT